MQGVHLTAELHECSAQGLLDQPAALRALCMRSVAEAGLTPVGELFYQFALGGGITGVVLLAESHVAVHTWPELAAVTLDVYVCNLHADNSGRAERLVAALEAAFAPRRRQGQRLQRGSLTEVAAPEANRGRNAGQSDGGNEVGNQGGNGTTSEGVAAAPVGKA